MLRRDRTSDARWVGPAAAALAVVVAVLTGCLGSGSTASGPGSGSVSSIATTASSSSTTMPLGTDGARIFKAKCAGCHGPTGEGNLGPSLVGVGNRMSEADQIAVVSHGRAGMLAFSPALSDEQIRAVVEYTRNDLH